jgi:hypothetical protein
MAARRVILPAPITRWLLATLREQRDFLDESALGEFINRVCLATATCGGIYWLMGLAWTWWALIPVVVSFWILVRCTRRASQLPTLGWSSAYVTIACLPIVGISAALAPAGPSLPAPISPFSPGAYLIMLAVVLIRDATEYAMQRRKTSHA